MKEKSSEFSIADTTTAQRLIHPMVSIIIRNYFCPFTSDNDLNKQTNKQTNKQKKQTNKKLQ